MDERISGKAKSVYYRVHAKAKNGDTMMGEIQGSITYYLSKPALAFSGILRSHNMIQNSNQAVQISDAYSFIRKIPTPIILIEQWII